MSASNQVSLSEIEGKALAFLHRQFIAGCGDQAARDIGHAVSPGADRLGAGKLGGRLGTALGRHNFAIRTTLGYRITTAGREVAVRLSESARQSSTLGE